MATRSLDKVVPVKKPRGEWVVLVHGLLSGPGALSKIEKELARNDYTVVNFKYDSRNQSIKSAADMLGKEIARKVPAGAKRVHFVTHSLGSIIVRYHLSECKMKNIGRFVMIAPPNQGSSWGRTLVKNVPFFDFILGIAGREVQHSPASRLPVPPKCEFGIIAGALGNSVGLNPFIQGDNDGTIAVSETELEGAKDYLLVRGQHTLLLSQKNVIDNVVSFIGTGKFLYR
jgi:triacylglycerol lipase